MRLKQFLLCMLALMGSVVARAYELDVNGIYYNIIDASAKTVEVTYVENGEGNADFYYSSISIPRRISKDGVTYTVTAIGEKAFNHCTGLTSVFIPNSVTKIGIGPFQGCSGLLEIVVDEENANYDSRNNCNAVIETATNTLVAGCKNTIIPEGVTTIDGCAFSFCTSLSAMTIPNSVTSIKIAAFENCYSLSSLEIPNSVTNIGGWVFSWCNMSSIVIPNSVISIGEMAFNNCHSLTSVVISNSVTSIGKAAFQDCDNLTTVRVDIDEPLTIDANTFTNRNL